MNKKETTKETSSTLQAINFNNELEKTKLLGNTYLRN